MPPKAKITRDMIIEAGIKVVREKGAESLNVRQVAAVLGCSTQPVMYHFSTVSELKAAVYAAADELHTAFIMTPDESIGDPFLSIGLRYIRFAAEERELFRFLFQSGKFGNMSFSELMEQEENSPLLAPLCSGAGLDEAQAREVFSVLFMCVHGAACLIANNSMEYEEEHFKKLLTRTFFGVIGAVRGKDV